MSNDWRVDSHDRQIEQLRADLREANKKIWALEMRPLKTMVAVMWIFAAGMSITTIIEAALKH